MTIKDEIGMVGIRMQNNSLSCLLPSLLQAPFTSQKFSYSTRHIEFLYTCMKY